MAVETETEFQGYTGDCVWAAVHMAAHRLAAAAWPLIATILNRLTSEAINAGIGVGPRGEADPAQLKTMLTRWGFKWLAAWDYNGATIPRDTLRSILDNWAGGAGKPVLLGFTNGQALTGDELGLHGHEIVVLHGYDGAHGGYPCGDGDSQAARNGQFSYYSPDVLEAAAPDSAYVITEVPGMAWTKQADGSGRDSQGHTCGTGEMAYLESTGLANVDGASTEVWYAQDHGFVPLVNGQVVRSLKQVNGQWLTDTNGAQLALDVWANLAAARNVISQLEAKLATATADPVAAACRQALVGLKSIMGEL